MLFINLFYREYIIFSKVVYIISNIQIDEQSKSQLP